MKKIAIILARSGSKGLKNKNMLFLASKPLSFYTIDAAIESNVFDEIVFSSDSDDYLDIVKNHYNNIVKLNKRSLENSSDTSTSFDAISEIISTYNDDDVICLLQPTSPLRTSNHIKECFNIYDGGALSSVVISKVNEALLMESEGDRLIFKDDINSYSRQKYKQKYTPNGAIYISNKKDYLDNKGFFKKNNTKFYIMDKISSLDIDDISDFEIALSIIRENNRRIEMKDNFYSIFLNKEKLLRENNDFLAIGDSMVGNWNCKKIINLGINGITTNEYLQILKLKKKKVNSDNLIVWIGNNDLFYNYDVDLVIKNIDNIINNFVFKKLYVISITNSLFRNKRNDEFNIDVSILNNKLHSKYGRNFIDLNSLISNDGKLKFNYTTDGLHLNDQAYEILERLIFNE